MATRGCMATCLNPCFIGIYSRSNAYDELIAFINVLILILLEYTHVEAKLLTLSKEGEGLNPYFIGIYSRRK